MKSWAHIWIRDGHYLFCSACKLLWDSSIDRSPVVSSLETTHDYTSHETRKIKSAQGVKPYLKLLKNYLPKSPARFLELGGGYGHLCQKVQKHFSLDPTLVEPGDFGRNYAKTHFQIPSFPNIGALARSSSEKFGIIFSGHVWEHTHEPQAFLSDSAKLLTSGGIWIAATPNASSWKSKLFGGGWCWLSSDHYQIISPKAARMMIEKAGLEVVLITDTRPAGYHYPGILIGWIAWIKEYIKSRTCNTPHSSMQKSSHNTKNEELCAKPPKPTLTTRIFLLLGLIAYLERILLYPIDKYFGHDELLIVARKK